MRAMIPVIGLLLLPLAGHAKRPEYNPSRVWPRAFGTGGVAPHEKVEEAFAQALESAGGGLIVVDPRLSAVADSIAVDELVNAERTGAEIWQQRRYEGAPQVVVPDVERFTLAHRAMPDARRWVRKLGVVDAKREDSDEIYKISAANGLTIGVGSARDRRQRSWVLLVGQGRFTMDDLDRPLGEATSWTVEVPDVERVEVYWQPAGDVPLGGRRGPNKVEAELPANVEAISVLATKSGQRFEVARVQLAEPEIEAWTEDDILADVQALRKKLGRDPLEPIDVLPCQATNLEDGTPLSGDRTCWSFPAFEDRYLWSELRNQPHLWDELVRRDRHYVAIAQKSDELVLQLRGRFAPIEPEAVKAAVLDHRKLSGAKWSADGSRFLDQQLASMKGETLARDAGRIRDAVLDADPLFTTMGKSTFAVGYGPTIRGALDMATNALDRTPSEVAVGYRELHSDDLGYLHVVAVATHGKPR